MRNLLTAFFVLALAAPAAQADLQVMPGFVNFGSVRVGSVGRTAHFSIRNGGPEEARLSITGFGCFSDFSVQPLSCIGDLPAGSSCSVRVTFRPRTVGSKTCTVNIQNSLGAERRQVRVQGQGVNR